MEIVVIMLLLVLVIIPPVIGITLERKDYNKGLCPVCGSKLRLFTYDSHKNRGYVCSADLTHHHCWVSYKSVDKI